MTAQRKQIGPLDIFHYFCCLLKRVYSWAQIKVKICVS